MAYEPKLAQNSFAHNPIAQKSIMRRREVNSMPEKQKKVRHWRTFNT